MTQAKEVVVPDIGDFDAVEIIEVNVDSGQEVAVDDTLITLETDKASMDIPSPMAGRVEVVKVATGDKVKTGSVILTLVPLEAEQEAEPTQPAVEQTQVVEIEEQEVVKPSATSAATESQLIDLRVPDIGGASDVSVIEVNVKAGDSIDQDQTLLTLESDKASMELPAPHSGIIREFKIKVGDKVSEGDVLGVLEATVSPKASDAVSAEPQAQAASTNTAPPAPSASERPAPVPPAPIKDAKIHTTPAIRRLAREFGVDLTLIAGSGRKGRILREDVQNFVKSRLSGEQGSQGNGLGVAPMPNIDFSAFGEIKKEPLSRIKKISAQNLHRNWVTIPHVTQFDDVDITNMEKFRKENKAAAEKQGCKLTPLVFLMKAAVAALKEFPNFNASLTPQGDELVLKQYYHVGVAVDTPHGLVVPVIQDVDQKSLLDLAQELAQVSSKARALKLTANDMRGSCFTISSLGGIGGTAFTPIINAPDVAILGVSKAKMAPVYQDGDFVPRLMLPLSLSYDHRVIDGAEAARFITYMGSMLADIRRLLL